MHKSFIGSATDYRKRAFRLLIILLICFLIEISIIFLIKDFFELIGYPIIFAFSLIFILVAIPLYIIGAILTVLAIKYKETKDYKYYVSIIGYPLIILIIMIVILTINILSS